MRVKHFPTKWLWAAAFLTGSCATKSGDGAGDNACPGGNCRVVCVTHADCETGKYCSAATGSCETGCRANADCAAQICDATTHACRDAVGCEAAACTNGQVCDAESKACRACAADGECGAFICEAGACKAGCDAVACADGKICNLGSRRCEGCAGDDDCGSGVCEQGACVAGCSATSCASSGQVCDGARRRCRACAADGECQAGFVCNAGACVPGCAAGGSQCASNEICDDTNGRCRGCNAHAECIDARNGKVCEATARKCVACTSDIECGAPFRICQTGQCVSGCNPEDGCASGFTCNPSTGRCVSDDGCTDDARCEPAAPAMVCGGDGGCVAGCNATTNAGCRDTDVCSAGSGRCRVCRGDAECRARGRVCEVGACVPDCTTAGCARGTCDATTGRCLGACTSDGDCKPPATVCENGACVLSCLNNATLCGADAGTTCDTTRGHCQSLRANGETCARPTQCASSLCLPLALSRVCSTQRPCPAGWACEGGATCKAQVCASVCAASATCDRESACLPLGGAGTSVCLSPMPFGGSRPGTKEFGAGCRSDLECHSLNCSAPSSTSVTVSTAVGVCLDTCGAQAQCGGASSSFTCQATYSAQNGIMNACAEPRLGGLLGQACAIDGDCAHGLCVDGKCSQPCCSSNDCNAASGTWTCQQIKKSTANGAVFANACVPFYASGNDPVGTRDSQECRSGLTINVRNPDTNVTNSFCSDVCCSDADCAAAPGWMCQIVSNSFIFDTLSPQQAGLIGVCAPRP